MTTPDYVVAGHVTKDLVPGGFRIGGTVTYAGLTAHRLGCAVGVVTSAAPDLDAAVALPGLEVAIVPAVSTTTFENTYARGSRRQYLRSVARRILPEHVPAPWRRAPIVHFGPLAQELGTEVLDAFPRSSLRGLTPQGWLRCWDESGLVGRTTSPHLDVALAGVDVTVLSEEDVAGDWALLDLYAARARLLIVTQGPRGATVCQGSDRLQVPAFSAREVDPTGAGDVFAAAFLIRLRETGDPAEAAVFANCAASFAVEGPGVSTLPDRAQVEERRMKAGR